MARDLIVRARNCRSTDGVAIIGQLTVRCGLGRGGRTAFKREGDGATPIGRWPVVAVLYRRDRLRGFRVGAMLGNAHPLRKTDGWCDAVGDRNYNRMVRQPYPASAEALWRDDHLYDVIVVLGHNRRPRVQGHGSAIFMHLARTSPTGMIEPTAGCVSLRRRDLAVVLDLLRPGSAVRVIG